MSLNIKKLKVSLPANPFGQAIKDFAHLSSQLEVLSKVPVLKTISSELHMEKYVMRLPLRKELRTL